MKKISIIRPDEKIRDAVKIVREHGLEPVCAPMIDVVKKKDEKFNTFLHMLGKGNVDYVIFTSTNGVKHMLENVSNSDLDKNRFIGLLNESKIVAIGEPTKVFIEKYNLSVDTVPEKYSSDGIVSELSKHEVKGKNIWVIRSSHGSGILIDGLKELGANVFETEVYSIEMPKDLTRQKKLINSAVEGDIDIFTFTSRMTVVNFLKIADDMQLKTKILEKMNKKMVLAIGNPTKEELEKNGIKVEDVPGKFTFEALISGIK